MSSSDSGPYLADAAASSVLSRSEVYETSGPLDAARSTQRRRISYFMLFRLAMLAAFTALAAARQAVLGRAGWDVNENGLFGAPAIRVLTSAARHASVDRALRFLGIGDRNLVPLELDTDDRVTVEGFERALAESDAPTIVVLDAAATPAMAHRMERVESLADELFVLMTLGDDRAVRATYVAGVPAFQTISLSRPAQ